MKKALFLLPIILCLSANAAESKLFCVWSGIGSLSLAAHENHEDYAEEGLEEELEDEPVERRQIFKVSDQQKTMLFKYNSTAKIFSRRGLLHSIKTSLKKYKKKPRLLMCNAFVCEFGIYDIIVVGTQSLRIGYEIVHSYSIERY